MERYLATENSRCIQLRRDRTSDPRRLQWCAVPMAIANSAKIEFWLQFRLQGRLKGRATERTDINQSLAIEPANTSCGLTC